MANELWRIRLKAAFEADGRSMNAVSLAAKCAPNYMQGILAGDKEPGLVRFMRLCRAMNVSPTYILTGSEVSPDTEEVVAALEENPSKRAAILALLRDLPKEP